MATDILLVPIAFHAFFGFGNLAVPDSGNGKSILTLLVETSTSIITFAALPRVITARRSAYPALRGDMDKAPQMASEA